jgi:PAS domain-containing protein
MLEPPGTPASGIGMLDAGSGNASAFNILFHGMPLAGMLTEASTGRVLDANNAFSDMFGWPLSAIKGQLSSETPLWVSTEQRQQLLDSFELHGDIVQFEAVLLCSDGRLKICRVSMCSILVDGIPCRLSTAQEADLDQRAKPGTVDSEIQANRERLNLALDAAQMGTWDWDIDTGTLHCCPRAALLHSHPPQAWRGPIDVFLRDI